MSPRNTQNGAVRGTRRPTRASGSGATRASRLTPSKDRSRSAAPSKASGGRRTPGGVRLRWWITPLAILLIVASFMAANYDVASVRYREYRERACLRQELAALDSRNARLSREVERLKTPEGVEDFARTELGLVTAGERVAVVMRDGEVMAPDSVIDEGEGEMPEGGRAAQVADGKWTAFLDTVFGLR